MAHGSPLVMRCWPLSALGLRLLLHSARPKCCLKLQVELAQLFRVPGGTLYPFHVLSLYYSVFSQISRNSCNTRPESGEGSLGTTPTPITTHFVAVFMHCALRRLVVDLYASQAASMNGNRSQAKDPQRRKIESEGAPGAQVTRFSNFSIGETIVNI